MSDILARLVYMRKRYVHPTGQKPNTWHLTDRDACNLANRVLLEPDLMPSLTSQERAELFADPLFIKTKLTVLYGIKVAWHDGPETVLM